MKVVNNVITIDEINHLKSLWVTKQDRIYVNDYYKGNVLDHRLFLTKDDPEFDIIQRIVKNESVEYTSIWTALQKQNVPHHIHIDDYAVKQKSPTTTVVIALDTIPEFKTIVWRERASSNEVMNQQLDEWFNNNQNSQISSKEDLEHTYDENRQGYLADHLTLDGIFTYVAGSAVFFDATQLHCTSNWVKYPQYQYRELLQIHYTTE